MERVNNDNRIRGFLEEYKLENCFITSNDNYLERINNYTIDYSSFENKLNVHKNIISRKSGQKIQKIANLQYYKSKANYGTKKKGISR